MCRLMHSDPPIHPPMLTIGNASGA